MQSLNFSSQSQSDFCYEAIVPVYNNVEQRNTQMAERVIDHLHSRVGRLNNAWSKYTEIGVYTFAIQSSPKRTHLFCDAHKFKHHNGGCTIIIIGIKIKCRQWHETWRRRSKNKLKEREDLRHHVTSKRLSCIVAVWLPLLLSFYPNERRTTICCGNIGLHCVEKGSIFAIFMLTNRYRFLCVFHGGTAFSPSLSNFC